MNPPNIEPWISFNKKTGDLCGNTGGFLRLREAIDHCLSGGVNTVDIEGEEIEISALILAEKPDEIPKPPLGSFGNLILFLCLLTLLIAFAGIGIVATANWLTAR